MDLVALVQPSAGVEPGHMVIGQESDTGTAKYFGFRFSPASLPTEFQSKDRWQEYLFAHKVPGNIHDERKYVRDLRSRCAGDIAEKRVKCDTPINSQIPPRKQWRHFASYSFRPDDFHSESDPCYNCVSWAVVIGNSLIEDFLTPVPQGRIKLILKLLRSPAKNTGDADG